MYLVQLLKERGWVKKIVHEAGFFFRVNELVLFAQSPIQALAHYRTISFFTMFTLFVVMCTKYVPLRRSFTSMSPEFWL